PRLGRDGWHGPQHHRHELPRPPRLRDHLGSGADARRGPADGLARRGARRAPSPTPGEAPIRRGGPSLQRDLVGAEPELVARGGKPSVATKPGSTSPTCTPCGPSSSWSPSVQPARAALLAE